MSIVYLKTFSLLLNKLRFRFIRQVTRMTSQENLLRKLVKKTEEFLVPLGIWPSANNTWIQILNIIVLLNFSVLVLVKSVLNPEGESIENAFTLANGGICTGVYFLTMIVKKNKITKFFQFIKSERTILENNEAKKMIISAGRDYKIISIALLCILTAETLIRFLHPPIEYGYIHIFEDVRNFTLPPAMALPNVIFGDTRTYILESLIRILILSTLTGICAVFIVSTICLCTQLNILGLELRNITEDDEIIKNLIENHQELLHFMKLLNEIFCPYFFADCLLSLINLSIMMFSLITHNASLKNFMVEIPMVTAGMSQLFFILYFGDRLIETVCLMLI